MEKARLTNKSAKAWAIPTTGELLVWDTDVSGLALRIRSSGAKSWLLKRGKRKWTIGRLNDIPVESARASALTILAALAAGEEPGKKARPTVADVLETYMTDHVATRCKKKTQEGYRSLLDLHILPRFVGKLSDDLTPRDIDKMLSDMAHIKHTANKCLALMKAAFQKALRWGLRSNAKGNPCVGAEQHQVNARETYLTAPELLGVLDALDAISQRRNRWHAAMCLRTLAVTGCRRDEMRLLEEGWIDWSGREVHWPDTKTGEGHLVLSDVALFCLRQAADHKIMEDGNPWLFRGMDPRIPLPKSTLYRTWSDALKLAVEVFGVDERRLEGMRPHDLRHSFASLGLSSGLTLDDVRRLLRHRDSRSTQRYARYLPSKEKELADRSQDFLQLSLA